MPLFSKDNQPKRGKRGVTKFTYTYKDIADLSGLSLTTIRIYASHKVFDPHSLSSIIAFITTQKKK